MELEDYEQSKEGGIRFVEDIFRNLGGKVLPPNRPGHKCLWERQSIPTICDKCGMTFPSKQQFYIHRGGHCTLRRYKPPKHKCPKCDSRFATQLELCSHNCDEQEFLCGYLEAQTRLRTSYLCKETVRPLSTSLNDRIVSMAGIVNGGGEDEPEVKEEKRQCIRDTRCSGCGRDDDFCRCGGGEDNGYWWGK